MNSIILMGRLTKDPVVKSGSSVYARYTIAVDRKFKKDGEATADFIDCVVFGKSAEFAEKYLHKGTKITVRGRLQVNNFKDKDDNWKTSATVIVEEQEFAESKNAQNNTQSQPTPTEDNRPSVNPDFVNSIPEGVSEELPF